MGSLRASATLDRNFSEARTGSQERPVRAERSESRSGALDGPSARSYPAGRAAGPGVVWILRAWCRPVRAALRRLCEPSGGRADHPARRR